MAEFAQSIADLVGNTPLLEPRRFLAGEAREAGEAGKASVLVKLEGFNPGGSAKDRAALYMISQAEAQGKLGPGSVIVEPTSGNTGIGLAAVAASRGYPVVLTMPDTMSVERRNLLEAYGARLILTPGAQGMAGAIAAAEELAAQTPGSFLPRQFENPMNPQAHYETTGPEIWRQTQGQVDVLVAGVGTGGTLTGAGKFLKEQNPALLCVAIEPAASPVLSGGQKGPHGIQGIGAGFVPAIFDPTVCDEILLVTQEQACARAKAFARGEGILVGISSGAALEGAVTLSRRESLAGKTIVAVLPDTGERYLSTGLFL